MVAVPEKWDVYHIMYQYFQYSTKYVPEKSVRVPTDLSAYNSAYHHYQLVDRKEREILVQNNCFFGTRTRVATRGIQGPSQSY